MPLIEHYRAMARNNAWSNARLMAACRQLSPAEFVAQRTSFFPSLSLTLNHILIVDWYYLDALEGGGRGIALFAEEEPYPLIDDLARAQDAADRRLIAYCDRLEAADIGRDLALDRGRRGRLVDKIGNVLPHLFVHQIHHRGQAHAMLAGTKIAPPQLDEFFLAEDRPTRDSELRDLGIAS